MSVQCSVVRVQEGEDDAKLKGFIEPVIFSSYRSHYKECIHMLNGPEESPVSCSKSFVIKS